MAISPPTMVHPVRVVELPINCAPPSPPNAPVKVSKPPLETICADAPVARPANAKAMSLSCFTWSPLESCAGAAVVQQELGANEGCRGLRGDLEHPNPH